MATSSWYASWNHHLNVFAQANLALVWWYHHVPRSLRPYAKGNHCSCSFFHEGQDHCSSGAKVLCLDRWFYSGLSVYLPANVDLEAGVRRERSLDCPPQVLLSHTRTETPPAHDQLKPRSRRWRPMQSLLGLASISFRCHIYEKFLIGFRRRAVSFLQRGMMGHVL